MTDDIERAAIIRVAPEILSKLLHLPKDAYIDAVSNRIDELGSIELRLRGAGWPVAPGQVIRSDAYAEVTETVSEDGTVRNRAIKWVFPQ